MVITPFTVPNSRKGDGEVRNRILITIEDVACSTDTSDLVVAIYFCSSNALTRGSAFVQSWLDRNAFRTSRGCWSFTRTMAIPDNLPDRYKLIRLRFDPSIDAYPRSETDRYGWTFKYDTFFDHLALLFAHELHHFRRYHLRMHAGEGEQSANRWALHHVQRLGYCVKGNKRKIPDRRHRRPGSAKSVLVPDPFSRFRSLQSGDALIVIHDPCSRYTNQPVSVLRPIRSNSKRIVIRTQDGETWRWPMRWLDFPIGANGKESICKR